MSVSFCDPQHSPENVHTAGLLFSAFFFSLRSLTPPCDLYHSLTIYMSPVIYINKHTALMVFNTP
uniref:Uncharacterized protein n=1 Tax=Anguilla anguilla TaxID=7936 RepID=A0A0E9X5D7_ANGAN